MQKMSLLIARCLVFSLACFGQPPGWTGPSSGVIFDEPTKSLRRIDGVPGAARLSEPLILNLEWSSVAPSGQRALARTNSGDLLWLEGLDRSEISVFPLTLLTESPSVARWNADSSAVRWYDDAAGGFFTLGFQSSGEPGMLGGAVYPNGAIGPVLDFTWDDAGITVVNRAGLLYVDHTGVTRELFASSHDLAFFLDSSGLAWAANSRTGEIFDVVAGGETEASLRLIAVDPERFADLSSIESSGDMIWAADRKTRSLYRIERKTGTVRTAIPLDGVSGRMAPLAGKGLWLIQGRSEINQPLFVLDGNSNPRVFFVPGGDQQ